MVYTHANLQPKPEYREFLERLAAADTSSLDSGGLQRPKSDIDKFQARLSGRSAAVQSNRAVPLCVTTVQSSNSGGSVISVKGRLHAELGYLTIPVNAEAQDVVQLVQVNWPYMFPCECDEWHLHCCHLVC